MASYVNYDSLSSAVSGNEVGGICPRCFSFSDINAILLWSTQTPNSSNCKHLHSWYHVFSYALWTWGTHAVDKKTDRLNYVYGMIRDVANQGIHYKLYRLGLLF